MGSSHIFRKEINIMIKGFLGKTHALLSIMLLCICLLIPINVFENTIWLLKNDVLFFCIGLIVTVGGALLPDLDNVQSAAGSTLGFMGSMFTTFMQSTSMMIWSLAHTKRERKPFTPHRYFWHTLIASAGIICLFYFGLPSGEVTIIEDIQQRSIEDFLQDSFILLFFILFVFMAVLCGSNMILSRIIIFFKLPKFLNYIAPLAICIYIFFIDYNHLHVLGICIGLGYLFHCIEDCFADTGVPILWPIPIKGKLWHRIKFFVTCKTDTTSPSLANTIIDIIVLSIDIGLIILIFLKGRVI